MINTIVAQTKSRRTFYRDFYKKGLSVLIVLLGLEVLMTMAIMFVFLHEAMPTFYASSSDGILTPLKAMPEPNRSTTAMLQ
jgi:hypothetical protein